MSTYKNPNVDGPKSMPLQAGQPVIAPEVFDFANTGYRPTDVNNGDLIQVGVVPAGCKLVPHLSRLSIPQLDTNAAPTGDYTVGSADDPDALKGSAAAETAVVLSGEDFTAGTSALGAKYVDVPIYVKAVADFATTAAAGKITADWVYRAFDSAVDVDVT